MAAYAAGAANSLTAAVYAPPVPPGRVLAGAGVALTLGYELFHAQSTNEQKTGYSVALTAAAADTPPWV